MFIFVNALFSHQKTAQIVFTQIYIFYFFFLGIICHIFIFIRSNTGINYKEEKVVIKY